MGVTRKVYPLVPGKVHNVCAMQGNRYFVILSPNGHPLLQTLAFALDEPFQNGRGFSLQVLRASRPRLPRNVSS